ncbi:MAG: hypothetical protein NVS9B15_18380 [Acidobacteriaceae bacterium]
MIYTIAADPQDANKLKLDADKVVDGRREFMGTLRCTAPSATTLHCHFREDDSWDFDISGEEMKGTLTVQGRGTYRKIEVKRRAPEKK